MDNVVHEQTHLLMSESIHQEREIHALASSTINRKIKKLTQQVRFPSDLPLVN